MCVSRSSRRFRYKSSYISMAGSRLATSCTTFFSTFTKVRIALVIWNQAFFTGSSFYYPPYTIWLELIVTLTLGILQWTRLFLGKIPPLARIHRSRAQVPSRTKPK